MLYMRNYNVSFKRKIYIFSQLLIAQNSLDVRMITEFTFVLFCPTSSSILSQVC